MRYKCFKTVGRKGFEFHIECSKCKRPLDISIESMPISFCPYCGHKLKRIPCAIEEGNILKLVQGMVDGNFAV